MSQRYRWIQLHLANKQGGVSDDTFVPCGCIMGHQMKGTLGGNKPDLHVNSIDHVSLLMHDIPMESSHHIHVSAPR